MPFYLRPHPADFWKPSALHTVGTASPEFLVHLSVDEGHIDKNGEFVVDRKRNGDETAAAASGLNRILKSSFITCD